jgi:hypothetical protein
MAKIHDELEAAKTEADRVIHDDNATPAQVTGCCWRHSWCWIFLASRCI